MFSLSLFRSAARFCRITPQIYSQLFKKFSTAPQIQTLGKYYTSQNLLQIYNIIRQSKLLPSQRIALLNQIQNIVKDSTEMSLNVLANLHNDKCILYAQGDRLPEAIVQIEKALKSIKAMDQPLSIQVASLLQTAANLQIKAKNYIVAQKYLKDAQHILNITEQQILQTAQMPPQAKQRHMQQINTMMAIIMSQFCLTHMQQAHVYESRQYLAKSIQRWSHIPRERKNSISYLGAIKFKCIIHVWAKQKDIAIQTAKQYLRQFEPTQATVGHRMWFMKFLSDQGFQQYKEMLKENITQLSKALGEKQITQFLTIIGVIKKPKNGKPNPQNPNQNQNEKNENSQNSEKPNN